MATPRFLAAEPSHVPAEHIGSPVCPRIGIDIGGVLTREGDLSFKEGERWGSSWEAPGAFEAVRLVVQLFGPDNVFLISKVHINGRMHREAKQWLRTRKFCETTGLPADHIEFVSAVAGPNGKGAAASRLRLSHFVDDKFEVLESVFSGCAGNSGQLVRTFQGVLFHFASGGAGRSAPRCPKSRIAPEMLPHYCGVAGWADVLERLRKDFATSTHKGGVALAGAESCRTSAEQAAGTCRVTASVAPASASPIPAIPFVRNVPVGIEEDSEFRVVQRLLGTDGENLDYISKSSGGADVHLCGRSNP